MKVSLIHMLSIIPSSILMVGITAMDIFWEIRKPNLTWVNPIDAVKNGSNVLVPSFICIGFMFLLIVVFVVGIVLVPAQAILITYFAIALIGFVLSAIFIKKLLNKCDEYIDRIEI